jgi:hypothetical protein
MIKYCTRIKIYGIEMFLMVFLTKRQIYDKYSVNNTWTSGFLMLMVFLTKRQIYDKYSVNNTWTSQNIFIQVQYFIIIGF